MQVWNETGKRFYFRKRANLHEALPEGVYILQYDTTSEQFYLDKSQSNFSFPDKIYDLETDFINRVMKTYERTNSNLGVLLVGVKGTGKSVTAKQLSNEFSKLKMPTIIIPAVYDEMLPFINSIQQDIVVFVDEYEKIFNSDYGNGAKLLPLMDGALDNGYRKTFILTANTTRINENLIQRPGRIRYVKKYEDTPYHTIVTIVDDRLIHKNLRDDVIKFISGLDIITIDIIIALIDEVNIHEESPVKFDSVFNIERRSETFDVYAMDDESLPHVLTLHTREVAENIHNQYDCTHIGERFKINSAVIGRITEVIAPDIVVVQNGDKKVKFKTVPVEGRHPSFSSEKEAR